MKKNKLKQESNILKKITTAENESKMESGCCWNENRNRTLKQIKFFCSVAMNWK